MLGLARGSFLFSPAQEYRRERGTVKIMKGSKNGRVRIFLIALAVSAGALLVTSLTAAAIAYASPDPTGVVGIYSLVALIVSAAISGALTARLASEGRVRLAALTSLTVVMVMLLTAVIVGGGTPKLSSLMNYLCYLGVSVAAAYLARPRKRRHKRR